jgi:hypothetical protein
LWVVSRQVALYFARLYLMRIAAVAFVVGLLSLGVRVHGAQTLRTYFVGNSLTEGLNLPQLATMAQSRGHSLPFGKHVRWGGSLEFIWNNPTDGVWVEPYGLYTPGLGDYEWDAVSLQPFARPLAGPSGDRVHATKFINFARLQSPDAQFFLYSQWPERTGTPFNYHDMWLTAYSGGDDATVRTRDYYNRLTLALRQDYSFLSKPIVLVPSGDVLFELNERMQANQIPGYTSVEQLYSDNIHLTGVGCYVSAVTYYATLFKEDPRGLPYAGYGINNPELALAIQDAAWDVVSTHPYAGFDKKTRPANAGEGFGNFLPPNAPEPAMLALPEVAMLALLRRRRA